jgi:hypothetical protein
MPLILEIIQVVVTSMVAFASLVAVLEGNICGPRRL